MRKRSSASHDSLSVPPTLTSAPRGSGRDAGSSAPPFAAAKLLAGAKTATRRNLPAARDEGKSLVMLTGEWRLPAEVAKTTKMRRVVKDPWRRAPLPAV